MPTTFLNFHAGINQRTSQNLMTAIAQKLAAGTDHFYILLSTPGGEIPSGMTVYNFLRAIPARITMHNIGNVDSIGNAIFLAADERYACAHSTFMFHGVGLPIQNLVVEERRAREILHSLLADQIRIADIIVERTNINRRRSRQLFREARTKDADEALATGIIHRICDPAVPAGADIISFVFP